MRTIPHNIRMIVLLAIAVCGYAKGWAQCFDMTTLDADGTYCACANHEYQYEETSGGTITSWYGWNWYDNTKEDYGLTGYNNAYRVNNILCTRQTIISAPGQDYTQPLLSMLPPGKQNSIRLGNPRAGGRGTPTTQGDRYSTWHLQAEAVYFEYKVDANNTLLQLQYAAVMDQPSHYLTGNNKNAQPRIEVFITDKNGNTLNANNLAFSRWGDYSINSNPEWKQFTRTGGYRCFWKDWSTVGFDLSAYIGQTVRFRIETYECVLNSPSALNFTYCHEHFSYLYFFLDCAEKVIEEECMENQSVKLIAPEGFTYTWYAKNKPSVVLGTQSQLIVQKADGNTTYCCRLQQKEGMTGSFVLESTPKCAPETYLTAIICQGDTYEFNGQHLTQSGTYQHVTHLSGGIDSTTYLTLTVQSATNIPTEKESFCEGSYYTWNDHGERYQHITEEGDYFDTLRYKSGCDSVRFHLQLRKISTINTSENKGTCTDALLTGFKWHDTWVNSANYKNVTWKTQSVMGCDSVVKLNLTVMDDLSVTDTVIVPSSNFPRFKWNGIDISRLAQSGIKKRFQSVVTGCDSTAVLCLIVAIDSTEHVACCNDELPITWHGHTIEGIQHNGMRVSEKGKDGKDSIFYTLSLTIYPSYTLSVSATICEGDGYTLGDTILYQAGTYTRKLTSVYGCDSTVTVSLQVQSPIGETKITRGDICEGDFYEWYGHGNRYAHLTEEGVYQDTLRYSSGCDSAYYTLKLYKHIPSGQIVKFTDTICQGDSLNFFGEILKTAGYHEVIIQNQYGCDSTIGIQLTVGVPTFAIVNGSFCEGGSFVYHGRTYTQPGQYTDTLVNTMGCDSIITLYITQGTEYRYQLDTAICMGEEIIFADSVFRTEGIYVRRLSHEGKCDSVMTLQLKVHPTQEVNDTVHISEENLPTTWNGIEIRDASDDGKIARLENHYKCDSIVTLRLFIHHVMDSVETDTICSNDGETYTWRGKSISIGNERRYVMRDTLRDQMQFDSIRFQMQLYVIHVEQIFDHVDICQSSPYYYWGDSLVWDTITVWVDTTFTYQDKTTPDQFTLSYRGQRGCESTALITVNYHKSYQQTSYDTICMEELDAYRWRGHSFSKGHLSATDTLLTKTYGCDSIFTHYLTVYDTFHIVTGATVCEASLPFEWKNGTQLIETFTEEDRQTGNLTREHIFQTIHGCDSVVQFTLNVKDAYEVNDGDRTCSLPYEWKNGADIIYTFTKEDVAQGTLTQRHTFVAKTGCDSIVFFTLLPQLAEERKTDTVVVTDGLPYTWEGHGERYKNLTEDGLYRDTAWYESGCDSIYYSLWLQFYTPKVEGYVIVDTICGNDRALNVEFICTEGAPKRYNILFAENAHPYFRDTTNCTYPEGQDLNHAVPTKWPTDEMYIRPNEYSLTLVLYDAQGKEYVYPSDFMVLYPSSILTQRWNDVLMLNNQLYNGGYEFSKITWYHDGEKVNGHTEIGSYIYEKDHLKMGENYWAELTRTDDGKTIRTCDFVPSPQTDDTRFAPHLQLVARHTNNWKQIEVETNISGKYQVFDASGKRVQDGWFGDAYGNPDILLQGVGCYMIQFHGDEGTSLTRKWISR